MVKRILFSPLLVWCLIAMALTVLAYALLVRPYHMRWGASAAEMAMPLPGDHYLTPATVFSTRAITIHAPVDKVWPWIVRLGQERNGFYSYDWLENMFAAGMNNLNTLQEGIEIRRPGDRITYMKNGPADEISFLEEGKTMIIERGWTFQLLPENDETTRLIVRYPFELDNHLVNSIYYYALFEQMHFVMEAGMMMGIKERAEGHTIETEQPQSALPAGRSG